MHLLDLNQSLLFITLYFLRIQAQHARLPIRDYSLEVCEQGSDIYPWDVPDLNMSIQYCSELWVWKVRQYAGVKRFL